MKNWIASIITVTGKESQRLMGCSLSVLGSTHDRFTQRMDGYDIPPAGSTPMCWHSQRKKSEEWDRPASCNLGCKGHHLLGVLAEIRRIADVGLYRRGK
jgi:hypothetical protein